MKFWRLQESVLALYLFSAASLRRYEVRAISRIVANYRRACFDSEVYRTETKIKSLDFVLYSQKQFAPIVHILQADFFFSDTSPAGWAFHFQRIIRCGFRAVALCYVSRSLCKRLTSNAWPWEIADCDIVDTRYSLFPDRIWKFDTLKNQKMEACMHEGGQGYAFSIQGTAITGKIYMKW